MNARSSSIASRSLARIALVAALAATASLAAASPEILVNKGDIWKYFKGKTNPSDPIDDWLMIDFSDSEWEEGPTGIGYADNDDATVLADMLNNYLTVFCRKTFEIKDPALAKTLTLRIQYDDGFVAWVNGNEVTRRGVGTANTPVYFDTPGTDHEVNTVAEAIVLPLATAKLVAGTNVLCISIHNSSISSSDLSLIPVLDIVYLTPPKFKRGDTDANCVITVGDPIRTLEFLFIEGGRKPTCLDAADADDSGELGLGDAIFMLNAMFGDGPKPPAPGHRECGLDPTDDALKDCVKHCCGE